MEIKKRIFSRVGTSAHWPAAEDYLRTSSLHIKAASCLVPGLKLWDVSGWALLKTILKVLYCKKQSFVLPATMLAWPCSTTVPKNWVYADQNQHQQKEGKGNEGFWSTSCNQSINQNPSLPSPSLPSRPPTTPQPLSILQSLSYKSFDFVFTSICLSLSTLASHSPTPCFVLCLQNNKNHILPSRHHITPDPMLLLQ